MMTLASITVTLLAFGQLVVAAPRPSLADADGTVTCFLWAAMAGPSNASMYNIRASLARGLWVDFNTPWPVNDGVQAFTYDPISHFLWLAPTLGDPKQVIEIGATTNGQWKVGSGAGVNSTAGTFFFQGGPVLTRSTYTGSVDGIAVENVDTNNPYGHMIACASQDSKAGSIWSTDQTTVDGCVGREFDMVVIPMT